MYFSLLDTLSAILFLCGEALITVGVALIALLLVGKEIRAVLALVISRRF